MSFVTTSDGTEIFYKDWGSGQPIVFHHGWPLSGDDWDTQMHYFLQQGFRVIAHDRRGHGRSTQTPNGNDMDTYAADVAAVVAHLDLRNAIHVGHSTGGGEVDAIRGKTRRRPRRQARAHRRGAAADMQTPPTRRHAPRGVRRLRPGLGVNRAGFYRDFPSAVLRLQPSRCRPLSEGAPELVAPGDGGRHHRPVRVHRSVLRNGFHRRSQAHRRTGARHPWRRRSDRADRRFGALSSKLLKNATLKVYKGYPHGMCTTHADVINAEFLAFIEA